MFHGVVVDDINDKVRYSYLARAINTYLPLGKEWRLQSRHCPKGPRYIPNDSVVNVSMFCVYLGKLVELVHHHVQEILVSLKLKFHARVFHQRDAKRRQALSNHLSPRLQIHCFAHRNHFSQLLKML